MDKSRLRGVLFQKYFQVENGVLISDLVDKLAFIPETWKKLHFLCENNIEGNSLYSTLEMCKMIEHNEKKYLILKTRFWRYVIIDVQTKKNITEDEFRNNFDMRFFVENFNELEEDEETYNMLYDVSKYTGDIDELLDFYIKNKDILSLSTKLHYKLEDGNAWTYLNIDFANSRVQMGFQTPNQYLYEQLFFNYDLTPSLLQDAKEKMGIETMREIFDKIKDIIIKIEYIPNDLYQEYLNQCNINICRKIKK